MIIHTPPPVYQKLRDKFGIDWNKGVIIAYAPNIHYKYDRLPEQKIAHEEVHIRQQLDMGMDLWWDKYINDDAFRLSQEIEAYTEEVRVLREYVLDRNERYKDIMKIAKDLSSSLYGNICTYSEAMTFFR